MGFVRIAALGEIPEGEVRAYDLPSGRVAVAHVEARLFAFDDSCTHAGCALSEGSFDDREATIECPSDGSVFDVETGEPLTGPAQDPVAVHGARLVDGWVEVTDEPTVTDWPGPRRPE
ncbi:MAG TPA: Rieske 2Fe-2S domain-containing protein [Actinomycetota bacterium]